MLVLAYLLRISRVVEVHKPYHETGEEEKNSSLLAFN